ncbi:MAG: hypothetical protein MUP44_11455, partial [Anaerolineales bacterium]|nr:hypothetical protein [Anaerolineales bacterium]
LGVPAVAAHVGFTHRTIGAGNRVRAADNADHQVALVEGAARTWIDDTAEGLVPQHQARRARRSPAVFALDNLDVRPTDADSHGFNQDRAFSLIRLGHLFVPGGPGCFRFYCNRFHHVISKVKI